MADILIKGLALPKDKLEYLHLIIQDGKVHTAISCGHLTTDKLNVATAIELPPHGDLIDRNEPYFKIKREFCDRCTKSEHGVNCPTCEITACMASIVGSSVVVEASK